MTCYYCKGRDAYTKIVLVWKNGWAKNICVVCFRKGRHLSDMEKIRKIIFYGATEDEINALPKDVLDHLEREIEKELKDRKPVPRIRKGDIISPPQSISSPPDQCSVCLKITLRSEIKYCHRCDRHVCLDHWDKDGKMCVICKKDISLRIYRQLEDREGVRLDL